MKLTANLDIKFRAFGFTFGHWAQSFVVDVPAEAAIFAGLLSQKLKYNDHGVKLEVSVA